MRGDFFNMLRKVLKGFAFHAGLTFKNTVLRLSLRLGLSRSAGLGDGGQPRPLGRQATSR
jgi:hypothetical protein